MRIIGNDPSTPRQAQIVASGTLSTGDAVVVNSDGTVSVVEGNASVVGTEVVIESETSFRFVPVYDSANGKVVIFFVDSQGGNNYGAAIVGTVSGTSISFGAQTFFHSSNTGYITACYDSNAEKFLVVFENVSGSGSYSSAVVGTVSGTSISFGTINGWSSNRPNSLVSAFDSSNNSIFVAYYDTTNTVSKANVATISGTSVSFGSSTTFVSAQTRNLACDFDSSANKVVLAYCETSADTMSAIVATISGTSVSFGSATQIVADSTNTGAVSYDSTENKTVVAYRNSLDSNKGTAIVGTVSGTSISFGSPVQFDASSVSSIQSAFSSTSQKVSFTYNVGSEGRVITGSVSGNSISFGSSDTYSSTASWGNLVCDEASGHPVIAFMDTGNSNYGTALVYSPAYPILTPKNYIGTAASGAADGTRAKINLKGAVDENQSGLTAGQSYYVQTDGTLGTTPADPSVFAGTAVAATKLIVKG